MSGEPSLYADTMEEVTETFIANMLARREAIKDIDIDHMQLRSSGTLVLGVLSGVLIGVVAYVVVASSARSPNRQQALSNGVVLEAARQMNSNCSKPVLDVESHASPVNRAIPHETRSKILRKRRRKARPLRVARRSLLSRGWRFYRTGNYKKASYAFTRVVQLSPKLFKGYFGLAISLFEQGRDEAALQVLERASNTRGRGAERLLLIGVVYQCLGREEMARNAYEKYLRNKPFGTLSRDVRSLLARERLPLLTFPDAEVKTGDSIPDDPL